MYTKTGLLSRTLIGMIGCFVTTSWVMGEPAPIGFTDYIIPRAEVAAMRGVSPESEAAVLMAVREAEAADRLEWNLGENLRVSEIQSYAIPEGVAIQVILKKFDLEEGAFLFISSEDPQEFQKMTRNDLENYKGRSAFFPAGKLVISLIVEREEERESSIDIERLRILNDTSVEVLHLFAPESIADLHSGVEERIASRGESSPEPQSLCGPDDRIPSSDNRIGRLMPIGCTGSLIDAGVGLTAGHCGGELMQILEFQVPASAPNGATRPARIRDQYPVIEVVALDEGIGKDWAVFRIGPNSNTGMLPGDAQGGALVKLSRRQRPAKVRVTGFGVDDEERGTTGGRNAQNQTQQTENGNGNARATHHENNGNSFFRYKVDTMGGNSGSPVFDEERGNGAAIAIHTNAGCDQDGNHGTSVANRELISAIEGFVGDLRKVFVD